MALRGLGLAGLVALASLGGVARGQSGASASVVQPGPAGAAGRYAPQQPYTMEVTQTTTQNFAGGLTLTHTSLERTARDSESRTRTERVIESGGGDKILEGQNLLQGHRRKFDEVTVYDPNTRTFTRWMLQPGSLMEARVTHFDVTQVRNEQPAPTPTTPNEPEPNGGPLAQRVREQLGKKMMFGVEVTGSRTTTIFPPEFNGNSIGYKETDEDWSAPGLGIFERTTESPLGKTSRVVTAYTAGEPDAALFRPPAGYTVVDEKR